MMIKKFFTWGYAKFVFIPSLKRAIEAEKEEFEIVFEPDDELEATINFPIEHPKVH
jgi:hypothetical protein